MVANPDRTGVSLERFNKEGRRIDREYYIPFAVFLFYFLVSLLYTHVFF